MPKTSIKTALVTAAHNSVGLGIAGNGILPMSPWWDGVNFQKHDFWHRVDVPAAITPGLRASFFNVARAARVTNANSGTNIVAGESAFWLQHLKFSIDHGATVAGVATATGLGFSATAIDPFQLAADIAAALKNCIVRLKVGKVERTWVGMTQFPWGGGPIFGGTGAVVATATGGIATLNNGIADASNKYAFTPPWAIYPDDAVELDVEFTQTRTNVVGGFVLTAALEGILTETT